MAISPIQSAQSSNASGSDSMNTMSNASNSAKNNTVNPNRTPMPNASMPHGPLATHGPRPGQPASAHGSLPHNALPGSPHPGTFAHLPHSGHAAPYCGVMSAPSNVLQPQQQQMPGQAAQGPPGPEPPKPRAAALSSAYNTLVQPHQRREARMMSRLASVAERGNECESGQAAGSSVAQSGDAAAAAPPPVMAWIGQRHWAETAPQPVPLEALRPRNNGYAAAALGWAHVRPSLQHSAQDPSGKTSTTPSVIGSAHLSAPAVTRVEDRAMVAASAVRVANKSHNSAPASDITARYIETLRQQREAGVSASPYDARESPLQEGTALGRLQESLGQGQAAAVQAAHMYGAPARPADGRVYGGATGASASAASVQMPAPPPPSQPLQPTLYPTHHHSALRADHLAKVGDLPQEPHARLQAWAAQAGNALPQHMAPGSMRLQRPPRSSDVGNALMPGGAAPDQGQAQSNLALLSSLLSGAEGGAGGRQHVGPGGSPAAGGAMAMPAQPDDAGSDPSDPLNVLTRAAANAHPEQGAGGAGGSGSGGAAELAAQLNSEGPFAAPPPHATQHPMDWPGQDSTRQASNSLRVPHAGADAGAGFGVSSGSGSGRGRFSNASNRMEVLPEEPDERSPTGDTMQDDAADGGTVDSERAAR